MDGRKDPLTDDALDRDLEALLAVDPSPEFVARIRARVDSEPLPANRWTVRRLATSRIALLLEAAAVVFMAVTLVSKAWRPVDHASSEAAPVQDASVTRPAPPAPAVVVEVRRDPAPVVARRAVNRVERREGAGPLPLPEVLIPEDEKRGFELFLEELNDQKNAAVIAEAASGRTTPGPPWLDIEPVIIEPLREVGTHQGEGQ